MQSCIIHQGSRSVRPPAQVLKLLAEYSFDWDQELLRKWGDVLWRRLSDAYIRLHAAPYVRAHAEDDALCADKAERARGLEEFAESLGVVDGEEVLITPMIPPSDRLSLAGTGTVQSRTCRRPSRPSLSSSSARDSSGTSSKPVPSS